eukprot:7388500-Prymnesium_polylepis.1
MQRMSSSCDWKKRCLTSLREGVRGCVKEGGGWREGVRGCVLLVQMRCARAARGVDGSVDGRSVDGHAYRAAPVFRYRVPRAAARGWVC